MRKRIADTSVTNYQEVKKTLGERQRHVLDLVTKHPDRTARELARIDGVADPNEIRPRMTELYYHGLIKSSGRRRCDVTGKNASTWRRDYSHEQLDLFGRNTTFSEETTYGLHD